MAVVIAHVIIGHHLDTFSYKLNGLMKLSNSGLYETGVDIIYY